MSRRYAICPGWWNSGRFLMPVVAKADGVEHETGYYYDATDGHGAALETLAVAEAQGLRAASVTDPRLLHLSQVRAARGDA